MTDSEMIDFLESIEAQICKRWDTWEITFDGSTVRQYPGSLRDAITAANEDNMIAAAEFRARLSKKETKP